jgi:hypothetical protein
MKFRLEISGANGGDLRPKQAKIGQARTFGGGVGSPGNLWTTSLSKRFVHEEAIAPLSLIPAGMMMYSFPQEILAGRHIGAYA